MKKVFFILGLGLSLFTQAQNTLHQVLILNEGNYDYTNNVQIEPVTIGSYNPVTQTYTTVNTLPGMRFASDLIIDGNYYYVAADTKIFKIDLNTHQEIASVVCPGVRNLGIYQNMLLATRGEYLTTYDSYLQVFNSNTLQFMAAIDTLNGPKWATQNIVIEGTTAYIAVNNGYEWGNEKGLVGLFDLNTLTYGNEIDLGPDGKNPDNLLLSNGALYTVNNKDWSGASVSKITIGNSTATTSNIAFASTGCGTSALKGNNLVYQISMDNVLQEFDVNGMTNVGPVVGFNRNFYELAEEPISGHLYASETDFFSYGKVFIYDAGNNESNSFLCGTSPGSIVFDVRPSNSIQEQAFTFGVFPNPSSEIITINSNMPIEQVEIKDASGRLMVQSTEKEINVSFLAKGTYSIQVNNTSVQHFVKL